tara:strand:- start:38 stop:322 length:285 start_codon:yes stop_codon:yes gene_type:complete
MTKEEQKKESLKICDLAIKLNIEVNNLYKTTLDKVFYKIIEEFKKDNEKGYSYFLQLPQFTQNIFLVDFCTIEEVEIYFYILERLDIYNFNKQL